MPTLIIDELAVSVPEGATVLQAVRLAGASLPTLCHWDGLPPYGACRLCLVEVWQDAGHSQIVAACTHPVSEGLQVATRTPQAVALRRLMLEFLLARCPTSGVIRDLAAPRALPQSASRAQRAGAGRTSCVSSAGCACACAGTWSAPRPSASSAAAPAARWLRPFASRLRRASAAAPARPSVPPAPCKSRMSGASASCARGIPWCRCGPAPAAASPTRPNQWRSWLAWLTPASTCGASARLPAQGRGRGGFDRPPCVAEPVSYCQ